MEYVVLWLALSAAVAVWASRWDRSGGRYLLFAMALSPLVAGVFLLAVGPEGKPCHRCGERLRLDAVICRFCGSPPPYIPPPWQMPPGGGAAGGQ
jgi:hypothetical protein